MRVRVSGTGDPSTPQPDTPQSDTPQPSTQQPDTPPSDTPPSDTPPSELSAALGFDDSGPDQALTDPHPADRTRDRRRQHLLAGSAAGALLLLVLAAVLLGHLVTAGDDPAPVNSAEPAASGAVHVQVSSAEYTRETLATGARALLTDPGPEANAGDGPSAGPLVASSAVAACLRGLGVAPGSTTSVDLATYAGRPAAIVVTVPPGGAGSAVAYVVDRECTSSDPGLLQDAVPVP